MHPRQPTADDTTGRDYETPAGAAAVDDELSDWEELLTADVNDATPRWDDGPERWESSYDPDEARNAGVIRTVAGALDPRTFNSKLRWVAVILVLLAGTVVPFAFSAGVALWAGVPAAWAAVVGTVVTLAYWRFC